MKCVVRFICWQLFFFISYRPDASIGWRFSRFMSWLIDLKQESWNTKPTRPMRLMPHTTKCMTRAPSERFDKSYQNQMYGKWKFWKFNTHCHFYFLSLVSEDMSHHLFSNSKGQCWQDKKFWREQSCKGKLGNKHILFFSLDFSSF